MNELVCQGSGAWIDLQYPGLFKQQYFCDEKQKSQIANIDYKAPFVTYELQDEVFFSEWYSVCEIDNDCGA